MKTEDEYCSMASERFNSGDTLGGIETVREGLAAYPVSIELFDILLTFQDWVSDYGQIPMTYSLYCQSGGDSTVTHIKAANAFIQLGRYQEAGGIIDKIPVENLSAVTGVYALSVLSQLADRTMEHSKLASKGRRIADFLIGKYPSGTDIMKCWVGVWMIYSGEFRKGMEILEQGMENTQAQCSSMIAILCYAAASVGDKGKLRRNWQRIDINQVREAAIFEMIIKAVDKMGTNTAWDKSISELCRLRVEELSKGGGSIDTLCEEIEQHLKMKDDNKPI